MSTVEILWEDRSLLLCVKQPGILSQPDGTGAEDLLTLLGREKGPVYPVHRLDRGVGGVMVVARTAAMAGQLSAMVQQHRMEKEYLAVIGGVPEKTEDTWRDFLFRDAAKNKTYVVQRMRKGVREAELAYRVLEQIRQGEQERSLVHIRLHTGRSHQIRVQFASRGMPVVGDGKYGGGSAPGGIALWSFRLSFDHPFRHIPIQGTVMPRGEPWDQFTGGTI